jgi:hypothetical protein
VKELLKSGAHKLFSRILPPKEDEKFSIRQIRVLYDKQPLQRNIEKFAKFPITTNYEKGEPRLLVVGVMLQKVQP